MIKRCLCCGGNGFRRLTIYQDREDNGALLALCADCETGLLQDLLSRETGADRWCRFNRVRQGSIGRISAEGGIILTPAQTEAQDLTAVIEAAVTNALRLVPKGSANAMIAQRAAHRAHKRPPRMCYTAGCPNEAVPLPNGDPCDVCATCQGAGR